MRIRLRSHTLNLAALAAYSLLLIGTAVAQSVTVGENIRVSTDNSEDAHNEVWLAIDPNDPRRQLAASMIAAEDGPDQLHTVVYASRDGGRTWKQTLDTGPLASMSADESCAFGPDGTAYYAAVLCEEFAKNCEINIFRSADGGFSWDPPLRAPASRPVDRPYVVVDTTGGKYRGRVYVVSQIFPRSTAGERVFSAITVHRSVDGGRNFALSALKYAEPTDPIFHPGNSVVTPDGKLVSVYREFTSIPIQGGKGRKFKDVPGEPNSSIKIIMSEDGGESLTSATTVAESELRPAPAGLSTFPYIAVDRGSTHFKGRLYAVWPDTGSGRCRIMFSSSADGGKSWERAKAVDDNYAVSEKEGPNDFLPMVAVNPQGVVGVAWYDRRDDPGGLGWHVRFAASLDGGDTFGPSVKVSSDATSLDKERWRLNGQTVPPRGVAGNPLNLVLYLNPFMASGGHTAGMEAGPDGVFRPLWVDNRTGVHQVWTAPVAVEGAAMPNGSIELSGFRDVSDKVIIEFSASKYDPATDTVTAEAHLKNISDQTLRGPITLRALTVTSMIAGKVEVTGADNGRAGPGATWDFTRLLNNSELKRGETSKAKKLTFRLSGMRSLKAGDDIRNLFVTLQARALSGTPITVAPPPTPGGPRR